MSQVTERAGFNVGCVSLSFESLPSNACVIDNCDQLEFLVGSAGRLFQEVKGLVDLRQVLLSKQSLGEAPQRETQIRLT